MAQGTGPQIRFRLFSAGLAVLALFWLAVFPVASAAGGNLTLVFTVTQVSSDSEGEVATYASGVSIVLYKTAKYPFSLFPLGETGQGGRLEVSVPEDVYYDSKVGYYSPAGDICKVADLHHKPVNGVVYIDARLEISAEGYSGFLDKLAEGFVTVKNDFTVKQKGTKTKIPGALMAQFFKDEERRWYLKVLGRSDRSGRLHAVGTHPEGEIYVFKNGYALKRFTVKDGRQHISVYLTPEKSIANAVAQKNKAKSRDKSATGGASEQARQQVEVPVRKNDPVQIKVVDASSGAPLKGVEISEKETQRIWKTTEAGAGIDIPAGGLVLSFSHGGYEPTTAIIKADQESITISLNPKKRRISLTVSNVDKIPLPDATVSISSQNSQGAWEGLFTGKTNINGRLSRLCPQGPLNVKVTLGSYNAQTKLIKAGSKNETHAVILIPAQRKRKMEVSVKDGGKPLGQASVKLNVTDQAGNHQQLKKPTNRSGRASFELSYSTGTKLTVRVEHPGYSPKSVSVHTFPAGGVLEVKLNKFKQSLYIVFNRSRRMGKNNFQAFKAGTSKFLSTSIQKGDWGYVGLGAYSSGRIQSVYPFTSPGETAKLPPKVVQSILSLSPMGSADTMRTLEQLPALMKSQGAAGKGALKSRAVVITTYDGLFDSLSPEDPAVLKCVEDFKKNNIALYVLEASKSGGGQNGVFKKICAQTGGQYKSLSSGQIGNQLNETLVKLGWHKY